MAIETEMFRLLFLCHGKGGNLMELSMREKELLIMFGSERRLRKIPMIKKVHDVLIYQRTYHKDIATRFSPREGFEDLIFTSKTNNPINVANIKDSINYIVDRINRENPEQEVRNYFLALNYLEKKVKNKEKFSKKLILDVQKLVEKGASKEKIGLRGPMPPGVLFAVYDSKTGNPDYIPPEYCDIPGLLDELVEYVNTTDDHPLIVAAVVHYQLVTIHPFEDGNGRTARLLSGYIMDLNGYGFNGIGSLEEYFAYDIDEYYESIQMGLPALYYSGRENPPHPEIWINYFLRMVKLYSGKVCDLQLASEKEQLANQNC